MRENYRNSIASIKKFPQFTTMHVIDGQAGLIICASLIFYSLTIDNILNIIVLLILAGISISMLSGDNGILQKATDAKKRSDEAQIIERIQLAYHSALTGGQGSYTKESLESELEKEFGENNYNVDDADSKNWILTGKEKEKEQSVTIPAGKIIEKSDDRPLANTITSTVHDTIEAKDIKGNTIVIPGGFKIASDSGETVQTGIVIEDTNENQFVWIPVSNINGDNNKNGDTNGTEDYLITLDDNSTIELTLGRYSFSNSAPGTPTLCQNGANYTNTISLKDISGNKEYFQELITSNDSTPAKNLQAFVESVRNKKGYYIARYEASYGSGSSFGEGDNDTYYKPLSQQSSANSVTKMNYSVGTLWNFVSQPNAALASRQMYYGNRYVESDLINSYAWDTAIVYIQAMGNTNYANANRGTNTSLLNTGSTGDCKCKIFDMAGNVFEWTTEHSIRIINDGIALPYVTRGGRFSHNNILAGSRRDASEPDPGKNFGFRPLLYVK